MTTSAVEVERKYDVDAGTAVPDLSGVPGVVGVEVRTYELDATYLDTEDLRLRAAATTLRRHFHRAVGVSPDAYRRTFRDPRPTI